MGYRLYLTSDAAAISPAVDASYEQSTGLTRGKLSLTKAGTNAAISDAETVTTNPFDVVLGQWVSDPFTHAGTVDLSVHSMVIARSESATGADFQTRRIVKVVSGDGLTTRFSSAFTSTTEWSTTLTAFTHSFATLGTVTGAVQAGDRIVVEYGFTATNTVTTSFTGTIRHGGTDTTDLANGDTGGSATSRSPYIEFDDPRLGDLFAPVDPPDGYRLYLTSSAAPISPTPHAGFEDASQVTRGLLSPTKSGANAAITATETSASTSHDTLIGQWVSAPITSAGTLSGDYSVTVARMESDAAADFSLAVTIRVLSGDGSVIRGVFESIIALAPTFSTEFPTAVAAETVGPFGGDDIACQVGDRIVVELGMRGANSVTTSYTATLRRGGTADTDLAHGDTGTEATTRSPHIVFHDEDVSLLFVDATGVPAWAGTIDGQLAVQAAFGADLTQNYSGWAWTDITTDVRYQQGIELTHGRGDEAADAQPASCRMTLDNRAGAYSLGPQSSNYPYVRRGTPIRVLADVNDGDGWKILFWGSADTWNPSWAGGPSGDATVALSASGVLRRLLQGAQPVLSTYRRAMIADTTTVAYWPLEDGANSDTAASAFTGHPSIKYTGGVPGFGATSGFASSAAMVTLDNTRLVAEVPPYDATGQVQIRWLASFPTSALTDEAVIMRAYLPSGTGALWEVIYDTADADGALKVNAYDEAGASILAGVAVAFEANGKDAMLSLELTQDGGDIDWELNMYGLLAPANLSSSGTVSGETLGTVAFVEFDPNGDLDSLAVGHLSVHDTITSVFSGRDDFRAYRYETVADRLTRLCDENDVSLQLIGSSEVAMGPQHPATLVELLRECEATDQGVLHDGLRPGISYVCRSAREAIATPDLTLDASAGQVDDLTPVDDDQRTRNLAVVSRREGSSAVYEDADGPHGTATIGIYDESFTVNPSGDGVLADYASWFVHVGTVADGDYRFPTLGLQLHRDPTLAAAWCELALGGRIDVTNIDDVRAEHPSGTISLALEGRSQRINQFTWFADAVCSPYAPWRVGAIADTTGDTSADVLRTESDGSTLYAAVTAGASSFQVVTPLGPVWTTTADDFPLTVEVEGTPIEVTAVSGSTSPQTFTVTAADVVRNLSAGAAVTLYQPRVLALPEA